MKEVGLGIYLHIPFCRKACHYCDFHFSTQLHNQDLMISALIRELEMRLGKEQPEIGSIYFGGGTPSVLNEHQLNLLMENIFRLGRVSQSAEITFEANPEDIQPAALHIWKKAGINRLSIGLQSSHDDRLRWMNRSHLAEVGFSSVKYAQDEGFNNISTDLMFGYPDQSADELQNDLEAFLSLRTPHLSAYHFTLEPETVFGRWQQKGRLKPLPEEESSQLFLQVFDCLESNGLEAYEISNFAQPGFEAVHNRNYWRQKPFTGIGPSAHGFDGKKLRYANTASNHVYVQQISAGRLSEEPEEMTAAALANEFILTRLRTREGLPPDLFHSSFGADLWKEKNREIQKAMAESMLMVENNALILTRKGRLFADYLAQELFFSEEDTTLQTNW